MQIQTTIPFQPGIFRFLLIQILDKVYFLETQVSQVEHIGQLGQEKIIIPNP